MLKMLLVKNGIEVTSAENGQTAVDLVAQENDANKKFVMILMDNLMPVMVRSGEKMEKRYLYSRFTICSSNNLHFCVMLDLIIIQRLEKQLLKCFVVKDLRI